MPGKRARRHFSQLSEIERDLIVGIRTAGWLTCRVAGQLPFRALPVTPEHRQLRLQWCQARSMWNVTDLQKVVISDEPRFVLGTDDNRVRVWRRPDSSQSLSRNFTSSSESKLELNTAHHDPIHSQKALATN
ncbi:uncharacterized protein TNCV_1820661 [Trichonephila clavipes]|nr:uncharacterized protein TNCV_1820661 [Trichonephila clavipes]